MKFISTSIENKKKVNSLDEIYSTELDSPSMLYVINLCNNLVGDNPNDSDLGREIRKVFNLLRNKKA